MPILRALRVYLRFSRGIIRQYTGLRTRNRRHFWAAVRHYSLALELNPDHVDSRRFRGLLYWRELNEPRRAIQDFNYLINQDQSHPEAFFYRGMSFVQLSEFESAAQDFMLYLHEQPEAKWSHSARIQLQSLDMILDNMPKLLSPPSGLLLNDENDFIEGKSSDLPQES